MHAFPRPSSSQRTAASQRISALAKLPVFFDLADKPAVVVGGTAAAAWKAELLAACGARVEVFARSCEPEMLALFGGHGFGTVRHAGSEWEDGDLRHAAIAIADVDDEADAETFAEAARRHGVPVNVIDKPAHCDFQFGALVNRSPVIVAISTDGAAPILGQAIRRRIEALLPGHLGHWAQAAKAFRTQLAKMVPYASGRRRFWERFADLALATAPGEPDLPRLAQATAEPGGGVTVVGAGPGDPDLLTLKAVRALQAADVVFHDASLGADLLDLARREARRIAVRGGWGADGKDPVMPEMLRLAAAGQRIVRLVTGDAGAPALAGEAYAGIVVDTVPGVADTAALPSRKPRRRPHGASATSLRPLSSSATLTKPDALRASMKSAT